MKQKSCFSVLSDLESEPDSDVDRDGVAEDKSMEIHGVTSAPGVVSRERTFMAVLLSSMKCQRAAPVQGTNTVTLVRLSARGEHPQQAAAGHAAMARREQTSAQVPAVSSVGEQHRSNERTRGGASTSVKPASDAHVQLVSLPEHLRKGVFEDLEWMQSKQPIAAAGEQHCEFGNCQQVVHCACSAKGCRLPLLCVNHSPSIAHACKGLSPEQLAYWSSMSAAAAESMKTAVVPTQAAAMPLSIAEKQQRTPAVASAVGPTLKKVVKVKAVKAVKSVPSACCKVSSGLTQPIVHAGLVGVTAAQASIGIEDALSRDAWGWDSMASACLSGNRACFIAGSLRQCPPVEVTVADGNVVRATCRGSVVLRARTVDQEHVRIVVDNVLYDKRFSSNLLSGELLVQQRGWEYHSTKAGSFVVTPGGHRIALNTQERVAVLMSTGVERAFRSLIPGVGRSAVDGVKKLTLLHALLGHMSWQRLLKMIKSGAVQDHGITLKSLNDDALHAAEKHVRECLGS